MVSVLAKYILSAIYYDKTTYNGQDYIKLEYAKTFISYCMRFCFMWPKIEFTDKPISTLFLDVNIVYIQIMSKLDQIYRITPVLC